MAHWKFLGKYDENMIETRFSGEIWWTYGKIWSKNDQNYDQTLCLNLILWIPDFRLFRQSQIAQKNGFQMWEYTKGYNRWG